MKICFSVRHIRDTRSFARKKRLGAITPRLRGVRRSVDSIANLTWARRLETSNLSTLNQTSSNSKRIEYGGEKKTTHTSSTREGPSLSPSHSRGGDTPPASTPGEGAGGNGPGSGRPCLGGGEPVLAGRPPVYCPARPRTQDAVDTVLAVGPLAPFPFPRSAALRKGSPYSLHPWATKGQHHSAAGSGVGGPAPCPWTRISWLPAPPARPPARLARGVSA